MQGHRLQKVAASLAVFGYADWQCLAAGKHANGDLQAALKVLLEGRLTSPEQARVLLLQGRGNKGLQQGDLHSQLQGAEVSLSELHAYAAIDPAG